MGVLKSDSVSGNKFPEIRAAGHFPLNESSFMELIFLS